MSQRLVDRPEVLAVLFYPRHEMLGRQIAGSKLVPVTVEPGVDVAGRLYRAQRESPLLLYFHGNGEIASDYNDLAPLYRDLGVSLLVMDYRGYGMSGGSPTAATLLADAMVIWNSLESIYRSNDLAPQQRYVMGRSLGSAAAIEIAAHAGDRLAGLVIESGFADTFALIARLGVHLQGADEERDGFRNVSKVSHVTTRTLIIHGEQDFLIPISDAEELYERSAAQDKRLVRIPQAGHNDLMVIGMEQYFGAVREFVGKNGA